MLPWQQRALGQLFDPGLDQQTETIFFPSGDPSLVPDSSAFTFRPEPGPPTFAAKPKPQRLTLTDDDTTTLQVEPPELEEPSVDPKPPNNTMLIVVAGVGVVAVIGIGVAIVAAKKPAKKKRKRNPSNPLSKGYSRATVSKNVAQLRREGYATPQASAIAYRSARQSYRKRYPRRSYPDHLKRKRAA